jgi:hypothetical protein
MALEPLTGPVSKPRLALYGWTDAAVELLGALERHGGYAPVAVGDERPAALARARGATGLACYQHARELLRASSADSVLVTDGPLALEVLEVAAQTGVEVLLVGDDAPAALLGRAAELAQRHSTSLHVLRPWLRASGLPSLLARLGARADWSPGFVTMTVHDPRPAEQAMRDAVGLLARLCLERPNAVAASAMPPLDSTRALTVQVRFAGGAAASLTVRQAPASRVEVALDTARGSLTSVAEAGRAVLTLDGADGQHEVDEESCGEGPQTSLAAEVVRVLHARGPGSLDATLAPREAALLAAIEAAFEGDLAQPVHEARPALRVLAGGGQSTPRPHAALTLVR